MIDTSRMQPITGYAFPAFIDGNDVVVVNRKATAFGGVQDILDGNDDGHTESGQNTATKVNSEWYGTGLIGCALPCRSTEKATANSPFADPSKPHIPWGTIVRVWPSALEEQVAMAEKEFMEIPLVDNGPDTADYPDNDFDFTVASADLWCSMTGMIMAYSQLCRAFCVAVNYRIIGAAKFVRQP